MSCNGVDGGLATLPAQLPLPDAISSGSHDIGRAAALILMALELASSMFCGWASLRQLAPKAGRERIVCLVVGGAFLSLAVADVCYDLGTSSPAYYFLAIFGESFYTVFFLGTAYLAWSQWFRRDDTSAAERWSGLACSLFVFILHLAFIIIPQPPPGGFWGTIDRLHDLFYSIVTSVTLVGVLALSARTIDLRCTVFYLGLCLCMLCDFSLRSHFSHLSVPEEAPLMGAWTAGLMIMALSAMMNRGHFAAAVDPHLAPVTSLRCGVALAAFASVCAFVLGGAYCGLVRIRDGHDLGRAMTLLWGPWAAANLLGVMVHGRLMGVEGRSSLARNGLRSPLGSGGAWWSRRGGHYTGIMEIDALLRRLASAEEQGLRRGADRGIEQRDAELGRLTAQVAHDLKSPLFALRVVLSHSRWIESEIGALALQATQRIVKICEDILANYRTAPKREPYRRVSMSVLVGQAVEEKLGRRTSAQGPTFVFAAAGRGVEDSVFMPVEDGRRALANLLENAMDVSGNEDCIEVGVHVMGRCVICRIEDRGPGFAESHRLSLGQRGASTKAQGHGLGLSQALAVISDIGGHVELRPRQGGGTTVHIELPQADANRP